MSERIVIEAEPRQVIGKQVSQLRREAASKAGAR